MQYVSIDRFCAMAKPIWRKEKKEKHTETVRNSSNSPHSKPQDLDVPRWPSSTRPWASPNIETCWQVQCKNEVCLCHKVSFWQKTRVTLGGRTASKGVPLTTASILHIAWAMQSYEDPRRAMQSYPMSHLLPSHAEYLPLWPRGVVTGGQRHLQNKLPRTEIKASTGFNSDIRRPSYATWVPPEAGFDVEARPHLSSHSLRQCVASELQRVMVRMLHWCAAETNAFTLWIIVNHCDLSIRSLRHAVLHLASSLKVFWHLTSFDYSVDYSVDANTVSPTVP